MSDLALAVVLAAAVVLVASARVSLTVPALEAPMGCGGGATPERMGALIFRVRETITAAPMDSLAMDVAGLEGERLEWVMPSGWNGRLLDVVAVDAAGNRARCASGLLLLQPVVDVPPPVTAPVPVVSFYDVAGRKLSEAPRTPGVYFRRVAGQRAARVVVLR